MGLIQYNTFPSVRQVRYFVRAPFDKGKGDCLTRVRQSPQMSATAGVASATAGIAAAAAAVAAAAQRVKDQNDNRDPKPEITVIEKIA